MSKQTKASIVFVHGELVGAVTAAVTSAQAGLNWLRAEPPDLEEVRQVLNSIASDGMRAAKIAIRLQALVRRCPQRMRWPNPSMPKRSRVAASHVAMLARPEETAKLILQAAAYSEKAAA
jgi:hypothetical protein